MGILKGESVSINPSAVRRVSTRIDRYDIPYFSVVYLNGDNEIFSVREVFVENVNCIVDAKICSAINDFFF